jgi:hypothetical protein
MNFAPRGLSGAPIDVRLEQLGYPLMVDYQCFDSDTIEE